MRIAMIMLRRASSRLIGSRVAIVCATESWRWSTPRSPWRASQIQWTYCSGSGRLSRYLARTAASTAGSRFSAPRAIAGLPGIARTPANTTMLATTSTTRASPALRIRKTPVSYLLVLESGERDAEERVRIHGHADDPVRDAGVRDRMIEVDQRPASDDLLDRSVV